MRGWDGVPGHSVAWMRWCSGRCENICGNENECVYLLHMFFFLEDSAISLAHT